MAGSISQRSYLHRQQMLLDLDLALLPAHSNARRGMRPDGGTHLAGELGQVDARDPRSVRTLPQYHDSTAWGTSNRLTMSCGWASAAVSAVAKRPAEFAPVHTWSRRRFIRGVSEPWPAKRASDCSRDIPWGGCISSEKSRETPEEDTCTISCHGFLDWS